MQDIPLLLKILTVQTWRAIRQYNSINAGDGADSIFGWNSNDSIKLGEGLTARKIAVLDNGLKLLFSDNN